MKIRFQKHHIKFASKMSFAILSLLVFILIPQISVYADNRGNHDGHAAAASSGGGAGGHPFVGGGGHSFIGGGEERHFNAPVFNRPIAQPSHETVHTNFNIQAGPRFESSPAGEYHPFNRSTYQETPVITPSISVRRNDDNYTQYNNAGAESSQVFVSHPYVNTTNNNSTSSGQSGIYSNHTNMRNYHTVPATHFNNNVNTSFVPGTSVHQMGATIRSANINYTPVNNFHPPSFTNFHKQRSGSIGTSTNVFYKYGNYNNQGNVNWVGGYRNGNQGYYHRGYGFINSAFFFASVFFPSYYAPLYFDYGYPYYYNDYSPYFGDYSFLNDESYSNVNYVPSTASIPNSAINTTDVESIPPGVWVAAQNGNIPGNAIVYDNNNGNPTYYCRAEFRKKMYYGLVTSGDGCYFTEGTVTLRTTVYEVLTSP